MRGREERGSLSLRRISSIIRARSLFRKEALGSESGSLRREVGEVEGGARAKEETMQERGIGGSGRCYQMVFLISGS